MAKLHKCEVCGADMTTICRECGWIRLILPAQLPDSMKEFSEWNQAVKEKHKQTTEEKSNPDGEMQTPVVPTPTQVPTSSPSPSRLSGRVIGSVKFSYGNSKEETDLCIGVTYAAPSWAGINSDLFVIEEQYNHYYLRVITSMRNTFGDELNTSQLVELLKTRVFHVENLKISITLGKVTEECNND